MFERQDTKMMNRYTSFHEMGHIWLSGEGKLDLDMQKVFCDVGEHIKIFCVRSDYELGKY